MKKDQLASTPRELNNYVEPLWRPLTVYAFDPSMGRRLNNYMTIKVPYEQLKPGPVGRKIAVIDYDVSNNRYYEAVNLDRPEVTLRNGLEPSESDPRFHQQMVYAVASETIRRFEFGLGRSIKWRRRRSGDGDDARHGRLRIFPHAFQQANAFYDPDLGAVLFGYFRDDSGAPGQLPGQIVFTCLSHDIIAHEVTHAILDGIREYFSEATSFDTPAFHEAFADIIALFQHFSVQDALIDTIQRTGGLIYRPSLAPDARPSGNPRIVSELSEHNPLVQLGQQFGQALGMRKSLREALGTPPEACDFQKVCEPHSRGAILVAAVFDAYFTCYVKRTCDLMRIARAHGAVDPAGDLHPDLARRLSYEASTIAGQFLNICVRAIDYCPPVDIQFGEYLRAIITADSDLVVEDQWDYRGELIKAFRFRGIIPEDVFSYSEEALRWWGPEQTGQKLKPCDGLIYHVVKVKGDDPRSEGIAAKNRWVLGEYSQQYSRELGLFPDSPGLSTPIQVHSQDPIYRIGPDGQIIKGFVVEFLQERTEKIDPNSTTSPLFKFRGGSTVIFDGEGKVQYVIQKRIDSADRLKRQRDYEAQRIDRYAGTAFGLRPGPSSFAAIHRGY